MAPRLIVAVVVALLFAGAATAAPPRNGVLVPGQSLGGLRLGQTQAQVRASWGSSYGVCRSCARPTWLFNYRPFRPKGAGVEFRGGRVDAIFTLWSPLSWATSNGLLVGDDETRVTKVYGRLARLGCGSYSALIVPMRAGISVIYVWSRRVWGFGLMDFGVSPCR